MRKLLIIFSLIALISIASCGWYPEQIGVGKTIATDTPGATNSVGYVAVQTVAAAESSDDDQIFNTTGGKLNTTTKLIITSTGTYSGYFIAQPDVPRNIIGTVNASTNLSVKITGTDIAGAAITENLTWASATGVKASTKAFKTVTRIDATLSTGETAKTLKLGTGDLLGLNTKLSKNTVLFDFVGSTRDTTAPAVTVNSTVLSLNTIDTYTAPGGAITKIWYAVDA